jgi:signal transduction histidine kinase
MRIEFDAWRRLLSGMNLAAYVTWVAVLVLVLDSTAREFPFGKSAALAVLVAFLASFIVREFVPRDASRLLHALLIGIEGLLALAICVVWRDTMSPVLTIMFLADCGMTLGARPLVTLGLLLDLALWGIFTWYWELDGAWRILLAYAGFQIFATLTAWYARRAEATSEELRTANAYLLATRQLLEESARDGERLRLARELHDVAGHKLTALKLNLTALQREPGKSPAVDVAAQLATELLADIRGVVAQMREADGLEMRAALAQLIAPLPSPRFHLHISDDARVDSVAQAEALLRAAQEAVTNIVRHSGAANAWIELKREGDAIRLRVRDDGSAALPLAEGFGLAGMRERLSALSGKLEISRAAAGGVALDVSLPLQPPVRA